MLIATNSSSSLGASGRGLVPPLLLTRISRRLTPPAGWSHPQCYHSHDSNLSADLLRANQQTQTNSPPLPKHCHFLGLGQFWQFVATDTVRQGKNSFIWHTFNVWYILTSLSSLEKCLPNCWILRDIKTILHEDLRQKVQLITRRPVHKALPISGSFLIITNSA